MSVERQFETAEQVLDAMEDVTEFSAFGRPSVETVGIFGSRPLKVAITWGDLGAVELLINAGASIDAPNEGGNTALHHAVRMSEFGIARRLVELGADQTVRNNEGKLARDLCWSGEWDGIGLRAG